MPSKIEYVINPDRSHGEAWNPLRGTRGLFHCVKVSPGCDQCYAERIALRFGAMAYQPGVDTTRLCLDTLVKPLMWTRPRTVFVQNMSDLFIHEATTEWLDAIFAVMALCPQHRFLVLTKRPLRMVEYALGRRSWEQTRYKLAQALGDELVGGTSDYTPRKLKLELRCQSLRRGEGDPLEHVWWGVTAEDRMRLKTRGGLMSDMHGRLRWLSAEPMLSPMDLASLDFAFDWVVVGAESGPHRRPMCDEWARTVRDHCAANATPFFLKQLFRDGELVQDLDGVEHRDMPWLTKQTSTQRVESPAPASA